MGLSVRSDASVASRVGVPVENTEAMASNLLVVVVAGDLPLANDGSCPKPQLRWRLGCALYAVRR